MTDDIFGLFDPTANTCNNVSAAPAIDLRAAIEAAMVSIVAMQPSNDQMIKDLSRVLGLPVADIQAIIDDGYTVAEIIDYVTRIAGNIKKMGADAKATENMLWFCVSHLHQGLQTTFGYRFKDRRPLFEPDPLDPRLGAYFIRTTT